MRHIPEAGAVCGNSARTDLRGGQGVTSVPTATKLHSKSVSHVVITHIHRDDLAILNQQLQRDAVRQIDRPRMQVVQPTA